MLQNSPFGERRNMLYLIEITKLNGKSLRNGWNAPRIGAKGLERTGAGAYGQGRSILKNTERTGKPVLWSRVLYLKNSFLIYLNVSFSPLSRSMMRRFSSSRAVSGCILSLACPRMK